MSNVDPDEFEHRPAYKRNGMYLPALFIVGIATVILGYVLTMQNLGWKLPALGGIATKSATIQQGVALYVSPNSKAHFANVGGNYESLIVPWRKYFEARQQSVKEITNSADLAGLKEGVLILPSAIALDETERSSIMRFYAEGGGVLTTWATGSRGGGGDWQGWGFLEGLGAKVLGEIEGEPPAQQLILNGESPISHQSPAGMRAWLGKPSEKFLRLKGESSAARIMQYSRVPDPVRQAEGALIFAEQGTGRSVMMAFAESGWDAQISAIYAVLDDSIAWLQHKPAIVKSAWPNGMRGAQLIEMDTEQGFPNALRFASMMRALDYRGTFYVLTSEGKQFPDVLLSLARDFEVGYHGEVHDGFKDQTPDQQQQRIQAMMNDMKAVLGDNKNVTGFRAPLESYDDNTEKLLVKAGIRHHTVDPARSNARLPELVKVDGVADALVILPRTQRDDINLSSENLTVEQLTQALIDDFDLAQEMGGLGLLSIHSQNYANDAPLTMAMPGFLAHLKKHRDRVWMASGGEVAQWWRERARLKLSSKNLGRRLEFNLSVTGKTPLKGASLTVILPKKGILPNVQALKAGLPKPNVQKIDEYRASIVFPSLNPGDYAYQATFE